VISLFRAFTLLAGRQEGHTASKTAAPTKVSTKLLLSGTRPNLEWLWKRMSAKELNECDSYDNEQALYNIRGAKTRSDTRRKTAVLCLWSEKPSHSDSVTRTINRLVGWKLTSLSSTNTAISERKQSTEIYWWQHHSGHSTFNSNIFSSTLVCSVTN